MLAALYGSVVILPKNVMLMSDEPKSSPSRPRCGIVWWQASNLIRALRQNREASALGLLEGQSQRSEGQLDIEVNVNKVRPA